ncbi:hypothetical protein N2152v2_003201 [Parachlorella kessleri]
MTGTAAVGVQEASSYAGYGARMDKFKLQDSPCGEPVLDAAEGEPRQTSAKPAFAVDHDTVMENGKAPWWEVASHLVTAMFGAGVLGLPYAIASCGWVLGLLMLTLATATSCYSAFLLAEMHTLRSGRRVRTLRGLAEEVFGKLGRKIVLSLQMVDLVGGALIFTVAGGTSLMDIVNGCYGAKGLECDAHEYRTWPWSVAFGIAMMFPDFHALSVVSLVGSTMPLLYSSIAFVSILVKGPVAGASHAMITKGGAFETTMNVFSGIGSFAYAFGGQVVQNEVTAMLHTPPPVMVSMRKAITLTYAMLAAGYFGVGIAGFAVFGNTVTGNILQSIPYEVPAYIANVGVLLHVAAAYQVFSMTVYTAIEEQLTDRKLLPRQLAARPWLLRLSVRTTYVCLITFLAALIPFFNQLSGLKGGACMVPLCFILPILMWTCYNSHEASTPRKVLNWGLISLFSALALVATVGSVYKIVKNASTFQLFA